MGDQLWTVGYERAAWPAFVDTLRAAGIARVLDVRDHPLSRRPGYSKRALAAGLAEEGIAYTHLRALGARRRKGARRTAGSSGSASGRSWRRGSGPRRQSWTCAGPPRWLRRRRAACCGLGPPFTGAVRLRSALAFTLPRVPGRR